MRRVGLFCDQLALAQQGDSPVHAIRIGHSQAIRKPQNDVTGCSCFVPSGLESALPNPLAGYAIAPGSIIRIKDSRLIRKPLFQSFSLNRARVIVPCLGQIMLDNGILRALFVSFACESIAVSCALQHEHVLSFPLSLILVYRLSQAIRNNKNGQSQKKITPLDTPGRIGVTRAPAIP